MKITKVTYQKAFITGPFLQEKIGFEAEIEDAEESVTATLAELKSLAEGWHHNNNPHLYQEGNKEPWMQANITAQKQKIEFRRADEPPPVINIQDEKMEIEIDNCTSVDELKQWKDAHNVVTGKVLNHYFVRLKEFMT